MNAREEVEPQGAGQGQHEDCRAVHESRLLAAPPRQIHRAGHDVLKDSEHRRKGRKRHEEEEETSPDDAARHVIEDVRQCDEDESRPAIRLDAVSEARGDDDESRRDGNKGIKESDVDRLAEKRMILRDVTAEDRHRADAEAQREERLIHRRDNDVRKADLLHLRDVRAQVE